MNKKTAIQSAQLQQLLSISNVSLVASILIATILAYMLRDAIPSQVLLPWYSFMVLATLLRAAQAIIYQRHAVDDSEAIHVRLVRFRLVILVASLVWGAAGFLLFPDNDPQHQVFLILMLAGMAVGGVVSFSADLISATVFSVLLIAPITIRLLVSGDGLLMAIGLATMLYLCFMIMSMLRINRDLCDNITLRLEATEREEFVRANEERYRLLLNYSPVGIFHYDTDFIITYCNNRLADILQSTTERIIGLDIKLLNDQTLLPILRKAFRIKTVRYEGRFSLPFCDTSLWLDLTCASSRDSSGNVIGGIAIVQDLTERQNFKDRINNLVLYDPLTHLPNRRLLSDRLQKALASSARSRREGAILFIDLDNFKTINDTRGHVFGDLLLQQVAQRLTACTRKADTLARIESNEFAAMQKNLSEDPQEDVTVARMGGDEFVVMIEDLSEHTPKAATQAETVGMKILAALSQPYQIASHEYSSTCSIGITLFSNRQQSTDELLKQADIAMYQAKKAGRNALRFFDTQMQEIVTARATLEGELRKALEKQKFQLYYQIQVDSFQQPIGAEALIRWNHSDRGLVLPAQFIALAEETGLILPIGLWVLETACAQLKAWEQGEFTRGLILTVNVSAREFRQADFVAQVLATVQRHAIDPKRLKLELTESLLLENIEATVVIMNALNDIGIQFSLDDFGTGYSSLQYLKRLPFDQIKIDQSFVHDLATDDDDRAIVRTIIAMAKSLNLDVIAEGVETEEQLQILLNKGCTRYQGYLFGKPVPIEQFDTQLKKGQTKPVDEVCE